MNEPLYSKWKSLNKNLRLQIKQVSKFIEQTSLLRSLMNKIECTGTHRICMCNVCVDSRSKNIYPAHIRCACKDCIKTRSNIKKYSLYFAIKTNVNPLRLLRESCLDKKIYAYNKNGDKIALHTMISSGEGIRVIQGTLNDKEVCIKYYKSEKRDIGYEISIYEYLDTLGVNLPWYSTEFYVLDHKVLVIEKLEKLSSHDDEYQMAHDIVSQLRKVKCRGVHSDIKPSNIMKKEGQYTLIDFGGFTREKLEHGYRRWVWTEQWTSQRMHEKKQITTPKHDLVELCFSIKHIQNLKSGKKSDDKNTKSGFSGRLLKFHERVMKINPKHVKDEDYLDLLDILNIA